MYGSVWRSVDKKEGSLIEQLGFEIMRDKGFIKDEGL